MEKVTTYIKAHPWLSGIIAIVGLIIFVMIVRGGGGGSGEAYDAGPSEAEISANAQLQAMQMQMQGQIQSAQIGAGVQLNSDNKAAEVAMAQINAQKDLGLKQFDIIGKGIDAESKAMQTQYAAAQSRYNSVIASLPSLKKKNRDDVLQALVTGQPYYPQSTGNGFMQNIGGLGSAIASIGSLFSDQRLKENIVLVGEDERGRNIYEFNYKGSNRRMRGYIAQDLERSNPELVFRDPNTGFMKVDMLRLN